ncbi:hypothetical protein CGK17_03575 [Vibrio parahaemolyticus]|nr:hypothetical protein CGK17_03575 [Vibrio parahaemolyticus]TOG01448.1 hypothetical protein CGJ10_08355 [Vibrio parahaemolyticus]
MQLFQSVLIKMEKHQSYKSITAKVSIRKMQRILDQLLNEIDEKHRASKENVVTLTRQSQHRLMGYKELYLHREAIAESELLLAYESMSDTEKQIADMGLSELTYAIEALDRAC